MYLEVGKNSITVTFFMAIFIHSKNFAAFGDGSSGKTLRSKSALRGENFILKQLVKSIGRWEVSKFSATKKV